MYNLPSVHSIVNFIVQQLERWQRVGGPSQSNNGLREREKFRFIAEPYSHIAHPETKCVCWWHPNETKRQERTIPPTRNLRVGRLISSFYFRFIVVITNSMSARRWSPGGVRVRYIQPVPFVAPSLSLSLLNLPVCRTPPGKHPLLHRAVVIAACTFCVWVLDGTYWSAANNEVLLTKKYEFLSSDCRVSSQNT